MRQYVAYPEVAVAEGRKNGLVCGWVEGRGPQGSAGPIRRLSGAVQVCHLLQLLADSASDQAARRFCCLNALGPQFRVVIEPRQPLPLMADDKFGDAFLHARLGKLGAESPSESVQAEVRYAGEFRQPCDQLRPAAQRHRAAGTACAWKNQWTA